MPPRSATARQPGTLRVLVIDDSRALGGVGELLDDRSRARLELRVLPPGDDPGPLVEHGAADCILLLMAVGEADGLTRVERLVEGHPDVPLVVVTDVDDDAAGLEAVRRGALGYAARDKLPPHALVRILRFAVERHGVETALRASNLASAEEARLEALGRPADQVALAADATGRITDISGGLPEVLGRSPEDLRGRPVAEVLAEHGIDPAPVEEALSGTRVRARAVEGRRGDGRVAFVRLGAVTTGEGDDRRLLVTLTDLSPFTRALGQLTQARRDTELILRSTGAGVCRIGGDGAFTQVNDVAARLLGWTAEEMAGRDAHALVHHSRPGGEKRARSASALERTRRDGRVRRVTDDVLWRRDGTPLPVTYTVAPLHAGAADTVLVFTDATEHHEARRSAVAAEERLRTAFDAAPSGLVVASVPPDGSPRVLQANPSAHQLLARGGRLVGARLERVLDDRNARPRLRSQLAPLLEGGVTRVDWQCVVDDPDLGERHLEGSAAVGERHADGTTSLVLHVLDVTARVQAQRETEHMEHLLHHAQKMESIGQLAGGIAHDFNNLLSVIRNYAHFAVQELGDHPVAADLEEVVTAADRAASLTNQLLVLSRREPPRAGVVDLARVLREAEAMLERTLGEDVALAVRAPGGPLSVRADRGHVEQVLMNLVVNARDAMPGGGALTIEARPATGAGRRRLCELVVTDTGTGMTEEVLERAFEPFFTTKPRGLGTGLGLASVYGLVTGAGGNVEVESSPGQGTTFRAQWPTAREPAPEEARSEPPPVTVAGAHVLVVEDDEHVRRLACRILEAAGFRASTAASAEEALALLAGDAPVDVVLSDVVLPGAGGPELAERLAGLRAELPVVFMTGWTDRPERLPAEARVVRKPFTPFALTSALHEALGEVGARA